MPTVFVSTIQPPSRAWLPRRWRHGWRAWPASASGFSFNSKANADVLMLAVARTLQERYGAGEIVKRDKPVAGPPSAEALTALSECDLALVGSAD